MKEFVGTVFAGVTLIVGLYWALHKSSAVNQVLRGPGGLTSDVGTLSRTFQGN